MKIQTLLLSAAFLWLHSFLFGQVKDSAKIHRDSFNSYDELREKLKANELDTLTYLDSTFNYQVKVPAWLNIRETGSPTIFGGTLPAINGIENAIAIKGFPKSSFSSFSEFKEIYLTGNTFGKPTKYSNETTWYGQDNKGVIAIPNGVKERVFTLWKNHIYHNMFVLLQTKSAYLFIQFSSTEDTYDTNLSKFDEFMAGLTLLNL